jgi:transposase-like protein
MPLLAADPVIVDPAHREALVRVHSTSQQLALRARMILHAADNIGVRDSTRELDVWPKTVRYWRKRWAVGARAAPRCAALGRAGNIHARADLRGDRDDLREAVGERAADQPLEPARDCR